MSKLPFDREHCYSGLLMRLPFL